MDQQSAEIVEESVAARDERAAADELIEERDGDLIVSLAEFADLCGVSDETMRSHLKDLPEEEEGGFILERGSHGKKFKILARAGHAWWLRRQEEAERREQSRADQLAQLRMELVGGEDKEPGELRLTGKQRIEEYRAEQLKIQLLEAKGELVKVDELQPLLITAVVTARQKIMAVPGKLSREYDLNRETRVAFEDSLRAVLAELAVKFGADQDDVRKFA
ncbi:MAG: hypothetical protein MI755_16360 [Sphingomonadales bacterium]|nr:hypothetical protein [Sphingomonadales bacterium]